MLGAFSPYVSTAAKVRDRVAGAFASCPKFWALHRRTTVTELLSRSSVAAAEHPDAAAGALCHAYGSRLDRRLGGRKSTAKFQARYGMFYRSRALRQ
jgi:hypothetical protein